jgi:hypothetical protein
MYMSHPYCVIVHFVKWTVFIFISRNGTVIFPLQVITRYGNISQNEYLNYRDGIRPSFGCPNSEQVVYDKYVNDAILYIYGITMITNR